MNISKYLLRGGQSDPASTVARSQASKYEDHRRRIEKYIIKIKKMSNRPGLARGRKKRSATQAHERAPKTAQRSRNRKKERGENRCGRGAHTMTAYVITVLLISFSGRRRALHTERAFRTAAAAIDDCESPPAPEKASTTTGPTSPWHAANARMHARARTSISRH